MIGKKWLNRMTAVATLAATASFASAQGTTKTLLTEEDENTSASLLAANQVYPDFFPLMAWDDVDNEETIRLMAECGINSIAFVPPHLLDACAKYNIKAVLYDERLTPAWNVAFDPDKANAALPELVEKYNDHPALYGYHLKDEPGPDQFDALAKTAKLVRELAPGKWPYINMLPNGYGETYVTGYLQPYIDKVKPPILSFDRYVIGEAGGFGDAYWEDLWDNRSVALANDIPLHTILLTSAHWSYRVPTDADLRLQIYGALVYGSRGLGYYKFRSRPLAIMNAPDLGNFRLGPLDEYDEVTPTYDHLKRINIALSHLTPTLLRLRSDDVYHIGTLPAKNHGQTETSLIESLDGGDQFIIGEFTHQDDDSRWVMVVNRNLASSAFCRPKFRKELEKLEFLSPITGKVEEFPNPWYALAPGQGVLLKPTFK